MWIHILRNHNAKALVVLIHNSIPNNQEELSPIMQNFCSEFWVLGTKEFQVRRQARNLTAQVKEEAKRTQEKLFKSLCKAK